MSNPFIKTEKKIVGGTYHFNNGAAMEVIPNSSHSLVLHIGETECSVHPSGGYFMDVATLREIAMILDELADLLEPRR